MLRDNDATTKRLRKRLRAQGHPCHVCKAPIDYKAHHLDPLSFQVDHLWQVANGGPAHDWDNLASAHRACNRARSNTIDAITVAAAARYGVTLTPSPPERAKRPDIERHAPDGAHCPNCNGTHNPQPGVTFITARRW